MLYFSCLHGCVGWELSSRLLAWNGLPLNTYTSRYARTKKCYNERGSRTNYFRSSLTHCLCICMYVCVCMYVYIYIYIWCVPKVLTDFLFNYLLDLHEITSYLLRSMTLGKLHSGSNVSSTDHSSTGSHFP